MYEFPDKGFIYITGKIESFISFFISRIPDRKIVFFYENEDEALMLREEIEFFSKREVAYFPVYNQRIFEKEDESQRLNFLYHLENDAAFTGLFPLSAVDHTLLAPGRIKEKSLKVEFGQTLFQEDLVAYLASSGYECSPLVREQGEYAKRGAIIDVFPPSLPQPVRIEFFGDQIYSLRHFDPASQRSRHEIEAANLIPAGLKSDKGVTIADYLPAGAVVVHRGIDAVSRVTDEAATAELLREKFKSFLNIDISGVRGEEAGMVLEAASNQDLREVFGAQKGEVFSILAEKLKSGWSSWPFVYIFASVRHQAQRLQDILRNYGIALPVLSDMSVDGKEKEKAIIVGPLRRGFRTAGMIVLTEEDVVGPKKRSVKHKWEGADEFLNSFKDLSVGDYIVHVENGIGVYKGIKKLKVAGNEKDFLLIEYQDEDKLYVPVDSLELVQKYVGGEKSRPKIDKLGTAYWKNAKTRVKKYVEDIAKELIDFYAERELAKGHAFPPNDELFREMEERFEYEETEGQQRVIGEVLGDMMNERPMDRIVCGDVGFGKTEVAIRSAFKAVIDNKQAAMLVPTTVLAQQHYKTFSERFRDYPINVEVLSRFRSKEDQARVLERLRKGSVDMVIGTHRLLQKDIEFKDLGLLIIDEEHRFGVKHKEKLKFLKKEVDVLTLSATPIPRTLHMAISGIKDLSIINTPPLDRLAVKTQVVKFNEGVIRKGVLDELNRGGQVFFVHNVIYNIGVVHEQLQKMLPDVRMAVAHGKMDGKELERIMLGFIAGKYDLLLSTNIIESGLDISNVNTIFINNAHRFGLADLYQLRGRVGRSARQSYAYLLVPKEQSLNREALARLKILEEMTELGSGLKVANYDLEIRGAGNLLGQEQSGHIDLVGFELYCRMLEEAVRALKDDGGAVEESAAEINLPLNAYIPDSYIGDETNKLLTYKRLSKIKSGEELAEMEEELKDRYGPIPGPLANLLNVIGLKIFLTGMHISRLECSGKQIIMQVTERTPLDMKKVLKMVKEGKERIKLLPDGRIVVQNNQRPEDVVATARNVLLELTAV